MNTELITVYESTIEVNMTVVCTARSYTFEFGSVFDGRDIFAADSSKKMKLVSSFGERIMSNGKFNSTKLQTLLKSPNDIMKHFSIQYLLLQKDHIFSRNKTKDWLSLSPK